MSGDSLSLALTKTCYIRPYRLTLQPVEGLSCMRTMSFDRISQLLPVLLSSSVTFNWRPHELLKWEWHIQYVYKWRVQFQKLTRNLFLTLHGTTYTVSSGNCQVSHALPAVRFSCLLRGRGVSLQDGVAAGKGFLCAPFWGAQICDYSAARFRKDTPCMVRFF